MVPEIIIFTHEKQWAFEHIDNAMMYLNETGVIAQKCWMEIRFIIRCGFA